MRTVLTLLGLLLFAAPARPGPAIHGLQAALDGNRVVASFALTDAFDGKLSRRIDSGLPTPIVYEIELHKDRKRWYDNRIDGTTLEVVAVHDAVARSYSVHFKLHGELVESRTVRDREALAAAMTRIEGMPVFTLGDDTPSGRLIVKVRARLGSRTLLSFIPASIDTDWKDSNKFRFRR